MLRVKEVMRKKERYKPSVEDTANHSPAVIAEEAEIQSAGSILNETHI